MKIYGKVFHHGWGRTGTDDYPSTGYPMSNCEITFYTYPSCTTIAKDKYGRNCVGNTDSNGSAVFEVADDFTKRYYGKITKVPFGYNNKGLTDIKVVAPAPTFSKNANSAVWIQRSFDTIIIIPPKLDAKEVFSRVNPSVAIMWYHFYDPDNSDRATFYYYNDRSDPTWPSDIDGSHWPVDEYKLVYPNGTIKYVYCYTGQYDSQGNAVRIEGKAILPMCGIAHRYTQYIP